MDPSFLVDDARVNARQNTPPGTLLGRAVGSVLLALTVIAASSFALYASRGPPTSVGVDDILAAQGAILREHAADYRVIVIGPSSTFRAVDPAVLDAAGVGPAYNASVPALDLVDADWLVRQLERGEGAPELVLFEPLMLPAHNVQTAPLHQLALAHDRRGTQLAVEVPRSWNKGVVGDAQQLGVMLLHYTGLGRASGPFLPPRHPNSHWGWTAGDVERKGYRPMELDVDRSEKIRIRREMFVEDPLRPLWGQSPRFVANPAHLKWVDEVLARITGAGATPAFLYMPVIEGAQTREAFRELAKSRYPDVAKIDLLHLEQPAAGELPDLDRWFDTRHLTRDAGQAFSGQLAEALRPLLSER